MKNIRCLLFDLDGTLIRTEHIYFETNCELLNSAGIEYDLETFIHHTFYSEYGLSGYLRQRGCRPEFIDKFKAQRDAIVLKRLKGNIGLSFANRECLASLRQHFRLGIVSNSSRSFLNSCCLLTELEDCVDFLVLRENYKMAKPNPDAYLRAVELSKLAPESCCAIEDAPKGLIAARGAKLYSIAVRNPDFELPSAPYADLWIPNLSRLCEIMGCMTSMKV